MNDHAIAALAIDVDGTLLDPDHRIRPAVRDAVGRVADAGVDVILASARFPGALHAIQGELGLIGQVLVACQGGVAGRFTEGGFERIHEMPIAPSDAAVVLAAAEAADLPVSYFGAETWHVRSGDSMAGQEAAIVGCEPTAVEDLSLVVGPAFKLTMMAPAGRWSDLGSMAEALPASVRGSISRPDYLEIVDGGTSKASALASVLRFLGLTARHLAAVGDGANDVEMLEFAALGIAMGHAPDAVKDVATWIVPSNASDGLAAAIDRLVADGRLGTASLDRRTGRRA
jgi:Cof subfamily protein (haloacid dehalogenase superfamily)